MPSRRPLLASLAVGGLHAAVVVLVALDLGYAIGPSAYAPVGLAWRYGGLVIVAAIPVWLAVRHRMVAPLVALVLATGYVLAMELTPPGPTFSDVAELEGLDEPTGITVVENGLYVVRYMTDASVWTVGFLLVGAVEHAARSAWAVLPPVPEGISWLSEPASRRQAALVAGGGGVLHAAVMLWFALRLGVTASGGSAVALYGFGAAGMWLLAAVPLYLLVRRQLIAPTAMLAAFVLADARAELDATVEDPHALYFGAWFLLLAVVLLAAGLEAGLRRAEVGRRLGSMG